MPFFRGASGPITLKNVTFINSSGNYFQRSTPCDTPACPAPEEASIPSFQETLSTATSRHEPTHSFLGLIASATMPRADFEGYSYDYGQKAYTNRTFFCDAGFPLDGASQPVINPGTSTDEGYSGTSDGAIELTVIDHSVLSTTQSAY